MRYQLILPPGAAGYSTATAVNYASRRILLGETRTGGPSGCLVTDTAHGTGGLAFGSDGTLLAGCGDGSSASSEDSGSDPHTQYQQAIATGLMTPAENIGAFRAQLVDSLSGKILRLDPATGDGVYSNPFYDPTAPRAARSRVWLLGLRDPQHFSVRPGSGSTREADGQPGTLYIGDLGFENWESLAVARDGRMNFGWPLYEGISNEMTDYAGLSAFNLEAPNPLFPSTCQQQYFRFQDLISANSRYPSWPNPCDSSVAVPAEDDVFVRDRPAVDWWHYGADARWAAVDSDGKPLTLRLGAQAPNGTVASGPLFGGTVSVGGVWYQGGSFPAPFRDAYFHADSGGQWIKAFAFDANDNLVTVRDFLAAGGPIGALANDTRTGDLFYVTGLYGSELHKLTYSPTVVSTAAGSAPSVNGSVSLAAPVTREPVTTLSAISRSIRAPITVSTVTNIHKEHPASKLAAETPKASGAPGWSNGDIGAVTAAGSYSYSGGTYTVNGSGVDIWGTADEFQFVYESLSGNGSITAEVVSQTNSNVWAKAGVMFRETLATGATNAFVAVTPAQGSVFQDRPTTGASSTSTGGPDVAAPYWVRVVRSGNTFTGYVSPNGTTWTEITSYTFTMATNAYVGLAVSSHDNGVLSTAVFNNVTVTGTTTSTPEAPTVPTGLAATNVTATTLTLSWTASINAGTSGVGGYYVYRNGSATPLATVTSGTSYNDSGLTAGTAYTYQVAAFDTSTPPLVSALSTALGVTTQSTGAPTFSNGDIGAVTAAGSYSYSGGTYTVNGSGADIWGTADEFQFVYESLSGNGSITAEVVSQTNSNVWAKAGVMFRETLATGATNAFVAVTPSPRQRLPGSAHHRSQQHQHQRSGRRGSVLGPCRSLWATPSPATSRPMAPPGPRSPRTRSRWRPTPMSGWPSPATTTALLSTAVFNNVTVTGTTTSTPEAPTVPTGLAATNVTATTLTLSWTASTNAGTSGVGGYYVYRNGSATPLATVTSGTSYNDSGLTAGTAYTYQVAAFDTSTPPLVSAFSTALGVTTLAPKAPTVPTGLAATNVTATTLTLSWTASINAGTSGVGGYYVYRNGSATPLATVTSGTSYNDSGLTAGTAYTYQVAAFDTSTPPLVSALSTALGVTTLAPKAPTVPTGLAATNVTATTLTLSWTASTNAGSSGVGGYYVYRNGSATPLATVTSGTSYNDSGLTAGTAYTYQVAAFDSSTPPLVSALSTALGVTTQSTGAPTFSNGDIGAVTAAGSYSYSGGTYTVNGSGADIWGTADEFQFVYESLSGNGSITAEVVSQTNSNVWAKAGVMFRETLATGATNAFVAVTPAQGSVFQDRPTTGASSTSTSGPDVAAPYWVRVVRSGNTFTGYVSPDGTTWTEITSYTFTMATNAYVGLAVSSHDNGVLSTAVFNNVTVAGQSSNAVSVSPPIAGITLWQTQQFTATVTGGGGATWTVDGVASGNSTVGTISSTGLYTPGTAVGTHNIVATSIANSSVSGSAVVAVTNLAGVYTYHNDLARDGANAQEYALTTANVNTTNFGKLFSCTADGAIYGQPLWVANLTVNGAPHNVVFVATAHDSLFAFDADTSPCVTLWSVSLIDTNHGALGGETTVPDGTSGYLVGTGDGDITPEVGVIGTPVYDPGTGTLYVVSKSVSSNQTTFYQRLHAINPLNGSEDTGSPVTIAGSYPLNGTGGTTVAFSSRQQNQRPGLAFVNGTIYIGWGSHEDNGPWYGWLMGYTYNGSSFTQTSVFNATPNSAEGGIWMSGGAPAADSSNNLYVVTGNGNFDASSGSKPNNDYGDSLLQLSSALSVSQYFTPSDQETDYTTDDDFGAGGAAVLADLPVGSPVLHLVMVGGKDGSVYALDRDLLGGYGDSFAVQKIVLGYSVFSTGAYWNDYYYVAGAGGPLTAFSLNTTVPQFNLAAKAPTNISWPGSTPSVSASATQNGIVWVMDNSQYCTNQSHGCGPTVLHAYNASNVASELWNSSMVSTDKAGNAVKFTVPTVANGKVYIGDRGNNTGGVYMSTTVSGQLDVYGLKP